MKIKVEFINDSVDASVVLDSDNAADEGYVIAEARAKLREAFLSDAFAIKITEVKTFEKSLSAGRE